MQQAARFRVQNHAQSRAILDASARVQELQFGE